MVGGGDRRCEKGKRGDVPRGGHRAGVGNSDGSNDERGVVILRETECATITRDLKT